MKPLISYIVTKENLSEFLTNQLRQERLFSDFRSIDKLVVCDFELYLPSDYTCKTFPREAFYDKFGLYNHGRAKNLITSCADWHKYDYHVALDLDAILLSLPWNVSHNQVWTCEIFKSSEREIQVNSYDFSDTSRWTYSSWQILGRDAFPLLYCEDFEGCYWSDIDYFYNVLTKAGLEHNKHPHAAIHAWHPQREILQHERNLRNEQLYHKRLGK